MRRYTLVTGGTGFTRVLEHGHKVKIIETEYEAHAEDGQSYSSTEVDIFMPFEILEHLINPAYFLKNLADETSCKFFQGRIDT